MKKIIYYISIFTLFVTSACTDLDENPKSFISPENSYGEIKTFESLLIGCYSKFGEPYDTNISMTAGDQAVADNVNFARYNVPIDNAYSSWKENYEMINNLNDIINNIDQTLDAADGQADVILGQAHFLRAIGYFYLVRYYGDIPLLTETPKTYGEANKYFRDPQEKVYELIVSDLQKAETMLPDNWDGQPGRASKFAAKAVLSKVYLTMAGAPLKQTDKYAMAAAKAKEIIDSKKFELGTSFKDMLIPINQNTSKAIIFQVARIAGMGSDFYNGSYREFSFLEEVTNPGSRVNVGFIDAYPEGPRKEAMFYMTDQPHVAAFIAKNEASGHVELNKDRKYFIMPGEYFGFSRRYSYIAAGEGMKVAEESDQNYIVFRYAEILMIYAEAQTRADGSPNADAYKAINDVRYRAYEKDMSLSGLSKDAFIEAVITERKFEHAFEAKRWFDVVRLELPLKYEIYGNKFPDGSADLSPNTFNAPFPGRYLMPIPRREIELNPNLTQNEGY